MLIDNEAEPLGELEIEEAKTQPQNFLRNTGPKVWKKSYGCTRRLKS